MEKFELLFLAAGKGTRMKSDLPKVWRLSEASILIRHLLESVDQSGIDDKPIIVVGYEKELVIKELGQNMNM